MSSEEQLAMLILEKDRIAKTISELRKERTRSIETINVLTDLLKV